MSNDFLLLESYANSSLYPFDDVGLPLYSSLLLLNILDLPSSPFKLSISNTISFLSFYLAWGIGDLVVYYDGVFGL